VSAISENVLERLRQVVGPKGWTSDPAEMEPWLKSWRDNWRGAVPIILRPASTAELAELVRVCAETRTPIVPQGGNTGLTGASQPHDDMSEWRRASCWRRSRPRRASMTGCSR
jgi:FAD/FMN-containing dehydrogenase